MEKMIKFLATKGVILVSNQEEWNRFYSLLVRMGLAGIILGEGAKQTYAYWRDLAVLNDKGNSPVLAFEYDCNKGIAFYTESELEKAENWFGEVPSPITEEDLPPVPPEYDYDEEEHEIYDDEVGLDPIEVKPEYPNLKIDVKLSEDKKTWTFEIAFGDIPAGMGTFDNDDNLSEEQAITRVREYSHIDDLYESHFGVRPEGAVQSEKPAISDKRSRELLSLAIGKLLEGADEGYIPNLAEMWGLSEKEAAELGLCCEIRDTI